MKNAFDMIQYLKDGVFRSLTDLAQLVGGVANVKEAIEYLCNLGVELEISATKGYRLIKPITFLDKDAILAEVSQNHIVDKAQFDVLPVVTSTNDYLWEKIASKPPKYFSFCLSEAQTQGKGRQGKNWCSPFGRNLYLSVYHFFPNLHTLSGLSLVMGLCLLRTIESFYPLPEGLGIKWPNDLFFNHQKIGGILIETQHSVANHVRKGGHAVIGLGVNLDLSHMALKETSWSDLFTVLGQTLERNKFAGRLISNLINDLDCFSQFGFDYFYPLWPRYDLLQGKNVIIQSANFFEEGRYQGINARGELLLDIKGKLKTVCYGDVSIKMS